MGEPTQTPKPTEEQLLALAQEIFGISRASRLELLSTAGWKIVERCYGGSFEVWNQRNQGDLALETLASRLNELGDGSWSVTRLFRAVRLAEQRQVFGSFDHWPRLTFTHLRAVQGLAWHEQRSLLDRAQQEGWNCETLEREARRARGQGEPTEPTETIEPTETEKSAQEAALVLRRIARLVDEREELAADLGLVGLGEHEYAALLGTLETLEAQVTALQQRLVQASRAAG